MAGSPPDTDRSTAGGDSPNSRWHRIYAGVMLFAALIIVLLLLFSRHYSG